MIGISIYIYVHMISNIIYRGHIIHTDVYSIGIYRRRIHTLLATKMTYSLRDSGFADHRSYRKWIVSSSRANGPVKMLDQGQPLISLRRRKTPHYSTVPLPKIHDGKNNEYKDVLYY